MFYTIISRSYIFSINHNEGEGEVVLPLLFLLTEYHAMKACWGSEGIAPRILDLGTRWR
jgi:hypothetical protein